MFSVTYNVTVSFALTQQMESDAIYCGFDLKIPADRIKYVAFLAQLSPEIVLVPILSTRSSKRFTDTEVLVVEVI